MSKPDVILSSEVNGTKTSKKTFVIIAAVILLFGGVGVGVYLVSQQTQLKPKAAQVVPAVNKLATASAVVSSPKPASASAKLKGDLNLDGKIDNQDTGLLISFLRKSTVFRIEYDLNGDGVVNIVDLVSLRQQITN